MATVPTQPSNTHVPALVTKPKAKKVKTKVATPPTGTGLYQIWPLTNEWAYQNAVGGSQPVGLGWDATATVPQGTRRAAALNSTNAILTDGSGADAFQMSIFVSNIELDSSIAGTTAQSQMIQDFYPHNFVQPAVNVTGWSLDQADYGLLCEFIHSCQQKSVAGVWPSFMSQLLVFGRTGQANTPGTQRGIDGGQKIGNRIIISQPGNLMPGYQQDPPSAPKGTYFNQSIHGAHQSMLAKGYVESVPREHQQFEYAIQWQFSFVVAAMLQGPYRDPAVLQGQAMSTWANILADAKAVGVVTAPTAKQNKAALAYAASNSATLVGAPAPGVGSTSTSSTTATGTSMTMYDTASTSSNIPSGAAAVAGYVDGAYQTYPSLLTQFPNAQHLSIAVQADTTADCLDIEPGNASPGDAGAWAKRMIAGGAPRPCLYADQSDMPAVKASLASAGLSRSQYRLWVADPSVGSSQILSGYDATQWQFGSGSIEYDTSLVNGTFF